MGSELPRDVPFGDLLRMFRLSAGMSQEALAAAANVSARTISDLERGIRTTPQNQPALQIANALALDGDERERYFDSIKRHRLPRGSAATRINPDLPAVQWPILGRDAELDLIQRRFAEGSRIVTLVGTGGVGKTRLALELAARREAAAPGAVIWLALDLVSSPAGVLPSIARACGVKDRGSGNLPARIADAIAGRDVLLALDNAEHVLEAMTVLPELLDQAPRLSILLTSRDEARISGERIVRVDPLPLPRRGESHDDLTGNPAVALYLDRLAAASAPAITAATASSCEPGGTIDDAVTVVRLLDGLPLAIELAAAQAAALPQATMANLLEAAGLDALTRGRRDGPSRFRTMEAAISWSVDLLPPGADRLLRLLGVFHGGFTAEAAIAIATTAGSPTLIGALAALANAQLVLPGAQNAPRFRLLEPVRLYARTRLHDAGEEPLAAETHARWFLEWGRRQSMAINGMDPIPALDAVEADLANLRAAFAWATAHGDPVLTIDTAVALRQLFDVRGYHTEFREIIDAALAAIGEHAPPTRPLMDALFWSAIFANMQGDLATSSACTERLRALAEQTGSAEDAIRANLVEWGRAGASAETRTEAGAYLRQALAMMDESVSANTAWMLHLLHGVELHESGDPAAAVPLLELAAASAVDSGCALDQPLPLARLGLALLELGREADARRRFDEALTQSARIEAEVISIFSLLGLARLDAASEDPAALALAARRFGAASAIVTRQALAWGAYWEGVVAELRARLAAHLGETMLARLVREGEAGALADVLPPGAA
ncbi:MAG: helix-turn-helix domain-containing protein [Thermomicrobiales bacterium]